MAYVLQLSTPSEASVHLCLRARCPCRVSYLPTVEDLAPIGDFSINHSFRKVSLSPQQSHFAAQAADTELRNTPAQPPACWDDHHTSCKSFPQVNLETLIFTENDEKSHSFMCVIWVYLLSRDAHLTSVKCGYTVYLVLKQRTGTLGELPPKLQLKQDC